MNTAYDKMIASHVVGRGMGAVEKAAGKNSVSNALAHTTKVGVQELPDTNRIPKYGQTKEMDMLAGAKYENSQMA